MKKKVKIYLIAFSFFLTLILCSNLTCAENISIIVNKANPINRVSFKDLVRIFKKKKRFWGNGKKIYLIMQEAGSIEKDIVLRRIYRMDHKRLKKFWIKKMYRGKISSFPITLSSNRAVRLFVSQIPNAIGYINSDSLDNSIKVLEIDGRLPGDEDYILNERRKSKR